MTGARTAPAADAADAVVLDGWRRGRVGLWRQPIREVGTLDVVRDELVARLVLPTGAVLTADRVVPVLARAGRLEELDAWVLEEAVRDLEARPDRPLEVNLSAGAVGRRTRLLGRLDRLLAGRGPLPGELVVALPAAVLTGDRAGLLDLVQGLAGAGMKVAVDGVRGTPEELAAIADVPVDVVKLAPGLTARPRELVRALRAVHGADARAVGQWVQQDAALERLRLEGADEAQGYLLGPPAPR